MDPPFRYRVRSQNSRTDEDDGLRFLSREEQECIQFFEKTIDSLEESLEENEQQPEDVRPTARSAGVQEVDGHLSSSPSPSAMLSTLQSRFHSSKDHDIIDLVRPQPKLVQSRAMDFNATSPDFHNMVPTPGSHLEMKPRHNSTDSLPPESSVSVPSGSFGSAASQTLPYHPPGCIPTPVLIAQKIAENQPGGASTSQPSPVHRRWSEEYEKPSSPSTDLPSKQGPPTSAKPTRYPANINVTLGSKEHQSHSLSNVNLQERRSQMLANLTGSHPLLQEEANYTEEEKASPRRSVSFRDPTPDKSRLEALSKLGLTRNRAMSGGLSLPAASKSPSAETDGRPLEMNAPGGSIAAPQGNVATSNQSLASLDRNSEIPSRHSPRRDSMSNLLPPTVPETNYQPPAVPQTNYQPPAVPQTNYQPPAVPQSNYQPPAVPQTHYQPPAVPQTHYQPPAVPQTNYQPPAVPQTQYQPPSVPQTHYQPPAVPQTNYQPPAVPQTNYQPPPVPQTNYQPPAVPQTNYQPPAVPQTHYQPPAVPQTHYQPPAVPQTHYQPPAVPQTKYQTPAVPQTHYQPPAVLQTHHQPPAVPQTHYQPPAVPQTHYQTPSVPQTNYQPPAVPQTKYQTPAVPQTHYQPPAVPQTHHQPPAVPQTHYQPPAVPQTHYQTPSVPKTNYQPPALPQTNYQPPSVPKPNYQPPAVPQTNYQPPAVPQTNYHPPPLETTASLPPHPEVTPPEFNSYGGKSILVKPTAPPKTETPASPTGPDPKLLPPALSNPTEFNTYGGKSKTISPAPAAIKRNDLPDILSSHMDKTQTFPGRSDPPPPESSAYREQGHSLNHPPNLTTKSIKAPAPTPAPRPPRNSTHGPASTQKPAQRALSPQYRRKPASMFPSHGITVQFSGRGATEESRKDALRKLGLLKES